MSLHHEKDLRIIPNLIFRQGGAAVELRAVQDEALLLGLDALLGLDRRLDDVNSIQRIHDEADHIRCRLVMYVNLHASGRARLPHGEGGAQAPDAVMRQRVAVLQLQALVEEALLRDRDVLLVVDELFDLVNRMAGQDLQGDALAVGQLDVDGKESDGHSLHRRSRPRSLLHFRADSVEARGN